MHELVGWATLIYLKISAPQAPSLTDQFELISEAKSYWEDYQNLNVRI